MGGEFGGRGYVYTYGLFRLRFDRKQQNSVKQISINKKIFFKKRKARKQIKKYIYIKKYDTIMEFFFFLARKRIIWKSLQKPFYRLKKSSPRETPDQPLVSYH